MNSQEYRSAIAALGLTQGQCAELLGIDIKTVWRYCNGSTVPKVVELAMRGLEHAPDIGKLYAKFEKQSKE